MVPTEPDRRPASQVFRRRIALRLWLVFAVLVPAEHPRAQQVLDRVTMISAVEVPTADGQLYRVSYEYEFPQRRTVFIDGIGVVSARGQLTYLSSDPVIRFLDGFGGRVLHTARIEDPVRVMGGNSSDLPRESEFPEAYRQGRWLGHQPFADATISILDRYFPAGYRAYRRADRQQFLTMFSTLPPVSDRVTARVAVLVSSPADASAHDVVFTLQVSAWERRSHSEWRSELTAESEAAVQKFVTELLAAFQRGSK